MFGSCSNTSLSLLGLGSRFESSYRPLCFRFSLSTWSSSTGTFSRLAWRCCMKAFPRSHEGSKNSKHQVLDTFVDMFAWTTASVVDVNARGALRRTRSRTSRTFNRHIMASLVTQPSCTSGHILVCDCQVGCCRCDANVDQAFPPRDAPQDVHAPHFEGYFNWMNPDRKRKVGDYRTPSQVWKVGHSCRSSASQDGNATTVTFRSGARHCHQRADPPGSPIHGPSETTPTLPRRSLLQLVV